MADLLRRVDNDLCGGYWTRYAVIGPRGAVNLTFSTPNDLIPGFKGWTGVDFGYHSPRPLYDGQDEPEDRCELLGEVPCFYDGSGLRADSYVHLAAAGEHDAIFAVLEAEYDALFGTVGA